MDMSVVSNLTQKIQNGDTKKHVAHIYVDVANVMSLKSGDKNNQSIERLLAWFDWGELLNKIKDELPDDCDIEFACSYVPYYPKFNWNRMQAKKALTKQFPKIFTSKIEPKRDVDARIVGDMWRNGVKTLMKADDSNHVHIIVVSGDHRFKEELDKMAFEFRNEGHSAQAHLHKYVWSWDKKLANIWNDGESNVFSLELVSPKRPQ
jgi:hypothetical protein